MEDGQDHCVHCLGLGHVRTASQDEASSINCVIPLARVREIVFNDQVGVES